MASPMTSLSPLDRTWILASASTGGLIAGHYGWLITLIGVPLLGILVAATYQDQVRSRLMG